MKTFLIVGKQFSGLRNKILERGDDYILLQDSSIAKHLDKRLKRRTLADFSSRQQLLGAVDAINQPIDGVITVYENYVLSAAWVAEHLGLPGLPVSAAEACTDKFLMRTLFMNAPSKISPDFAEIDSWEKLEQFAKDHGFPLILKPANLVKSLLVTKNHTLDELQSNYQKACDLLESTYKKHAPYRTPKMLVEEFLEGPVHSVDAFVDEAGLPHVLEQVVDYETGYDIGYEDNFHYSRILPSKLLASEITAIRETARIGCQALQMRSSPAHIEIISTADGPRIVEIGARNGGYRERMHRLANGIDILGNALDIALGRLPDIVASKNESCAVLELFPRSAGIFSDISHESELHDLPSLQYFALKQTPGEYVGKSSDGYKMCAIIILHHQDAVQFERDLAYVNQHVAVRTR